MAPGFRGVKDDSSKGNMNFRCPPDLRRHIAQVGKDENRNQTEVIVDALTLDRDLQQKLKDIYLKIRGYADAQGLSMSEELSEVLARLVRMGVEAYETDPKLHR